MPREFDYREDEREAAGYPAAVPRDTLFPILPKRDDTGTEVSLEEMWPNGWGLSGVRTHQFRLDPPEGTWPYDNALVDPVYDWMVENLKGRWNWFEQETNHGHSASTHVWIDEPGEIEAFRERWGSVFLLNERDLAEDTEVREAERTALAAR